MAPWRRPDSGVIDYSPIHISKMVLPTVNLGPPPLTVDTTIFELWLGACDPPHRSPHGKFGTLLMGLCGAYGDCRQEHL